MRKAKYNLVVYSQQLSYLWLWSDKIWLTRLVSLMKEVLSAGFVEITAPLAC